MIEQLNKAFENRIRLGLMSILMVNKDVDFNRAKELLKVTDGNLASHSMALEKLEYIEILKEFVGKKPRTTYRATKLGKNEFKKHINGLEKLLNQK